MSTCFKTSLAALIVLTLLAGCSRATPREAVVPPTDVPQSTDVATFSEATLAVTPPPKVTPIGIPLDTVTPPLYDNNGGAAMIAPQNLHTLERLYSLSGYATAFHPQEAVIVTGELTGKVKVWSLADGSLLRELTDLHEMVFDLDFSPDGSLLAAAFGARSAVMDTTTAATQATFAGLGQIIQSVAFSPDGALLAVGGSDGIKIFRTTNWEEIAELHGHEGGVFDLDFAPDGKVLVSAGGMPDSRVIVWNTETLEIEHTLEGHGGDVHSLAISPDSRSVISGGVDRRLFVWDLSAGKSLGELSGYQDVIYGLAYSPAGTLVAAACGHDGYVMFWDIGANQAPFKLVDRGIEVRRVQFSPDGRLLAESNDQHEVVVWGSSKD